jgi:uncharacterized BrkB/YihY/UPF0761 family membrane protein
MSAHFVSQVLAITAQAMALGSRVLAKSAVLASQHDKRQHVACSFSIYIVLSMFAPVALALALTMLVGLLKEVWDKYFGTGFCYYDLLSNCVGVGLAVPIGYLINASIRT